MLARAQRCSVVPWWVVALLGTVSEMVHWDCTTRCCRRVNPFGAAGALEQLSPGLPLTLCFVPRCRGGCPASHGHASAHRAPPGKWKRSFGGIRGQRPLSRHDGAVSCLWGTAKAGNAPVRPGLASPTLPSELAWRHHVGKEMGGGGGCVFIPLG